LCREHSRLNKSTPHSHPSDKVDQSYFYCYDTLLPADPHHEFHYVVGDHLCTNGELYSLGWHWTIFGNLSHPRSWHEH